MAVGQVPQAPKEESLLDTVSGLEAAVDRLAMLLGLTEAVKSECIPASNPILTARDRIVQARVRVVDFANYLEKRIETFQIDFGEKLL